MRADLSRFIHLPLGRPVLNLSALVEFIGGPWDGQWRVESRPAFDLYFSGDDDDTIGRGRYVRGDDGRFRWRSENQER